MNKPKAEDLIQKYANGLCTPEEKALVESGFLSDLKNSDVSVSENEIELASHRIFENINEHIVSRETLVNKTYSLFSRAIAVAATLFLLAGFGWLFYKNYQQDIKHNNTYSNIKPGGNKAYLTLADGKRIVLTDAANGEIALQSGIKITKEADGKVVYEISETPNSANGAAIYNTIETPNGGQYQIILPDRTTVWLNAASSLKFPTRFTNSQRKVEISGEAYFEVSKQTVGGERVPFIVDIKTSSGDAGRIEVLGTHFNIMAYNNEKKVETTLIEGSVKVVKSNQALLLKPGEQARTTNVKSAIELIENVDTDEILAWKKGEFNFHNEDIESILRQIGRWYDVEIVIDGVLPDEEFNGKISRSENLSQVVKVLKLNGLNLKIEGRKLIVKP